MAFKVEELKYKDKKNVEHSYNPPMYKSLFTMNEPHLVIEKVTTGKKPTLQDVYSELYSTSNDLIVSSIAIANNLSSQQWEFIYNYVQTIEGGKTYLTGDIAKVTLNTIEYIVVFLHPMTIQLDTNYNDYETKSYIKLIPQPKVTGDSGVIGD